MALGSDARAFSAFSSAIGYGAAATGSLSAAVGYLARVGASGAAVGGRSEALGNNSTAVGFQASATGIGTTAIGLNSVASQTRAIAIGALSQATAIRSVAIGRAAASTAINQVTLGGAGSSVRVGDIDASTAKQTGPVNAVTVDPSGTLGKGAVASAAQLGSLQSSMARALAVSDAQFGALSGRVGVVEGQINTLFDLATHDRKDSRRGIAAAMAMADAPMPSEPGKTSYAAKGSVFRGELAVGASLSHRLDTGSPFALTASLSHAGAGFGRGTTVVATTRCPPPTMRRV